MAVENFSELQEQLLLQYPEICRSCDRVAAVVVSITCRGSRSEEQVRTMIAEDIARVRSECLGEVPVSEPGCFSDPTECYLQSEAYVERITTIAN